MPVVSFLYMKTTWIRINELKEKKRLYGTLSEEDSKLLVLLEKLIDAPDTELELRKEEIEAELNWRNKQLPIKTKFNKWFNEYGIFVIFIIILLFLAYL